MFDRFQDQTNVVASDIGLNIFFEIWPIILPANEIFYFINTKMICQKVIVMPANKVCLNDFKHK